MKKVFSLILICFLLFTMAACGEEKSNYELLDERDKGIVNNILAHENMFSECNGFKFADYNGKKYFVTTYTKYSNHESGPFGGAAGYTESIKYFVIGPDTFVQEAWDAYNGQTAMGFIFQWDSNWDLAVKKEKLATAINS